MTSRTLQLGLVFACLLLVGAAGATIASSRAVVPGAGLTMAVNVTIEPLTCDSSASSTSCVDITSDGANITHIFVDSGCAMSSSDFLITVDGEPVEHLYTNDGPCENIPRDVWFPLQTPQDTAHICVSVQGTGPGPLRVSAKAGNECIIGTTP
jgi:hypothetical protein